MSRWNECDRFCPRSVLGRFDPTSLPVMEITTSVATYLLTYLLELHKVWQRLCAVASPNIFVFCDSSCGSSVAATWTLFPVLFRVILYATKVSCSFMPLLIAPDPGDATGNDSKKRYRSSDVFCMKNDGEVLNTEVTCWGRSHSRYERQQREMFGHRRMQYKLQTHTAFIHQTKNGSKKNKSIYKYIYIYSCLLYTSPSPRD